MRRTRAGCAWLQGTHTAAGEIVARAMTGHMTQAMTDHYRHVTLAEKSAALVAALGPLGTAVGVPVGVPVGEDRKHTPTGDGHGGVMSGWMPVVGAPETGSKGAQPLGVTACRPSRESSQSEDSLPALVDGEGAHRAM